MRGVSHRVNRNFMEKLLARFAMTGPISVVENHWIGSRESHPSVTSRSITDYASKYFSIRSLIA